MLIGNEARKTPELLLLFIPTRRYLHLKTTSKSVAQQCAKYIKFIATMLEKNCNEIEARWFRSLPANLAHKQKASAPSPPERPAPASLRTCSDTGGARSHRRSVRGQGAADVMQPRIPFDLVPLAPSFSQAKLAGLKTRAAKARAEAAQGSSMSPGKVKKKELSKMLAQAS